MKELSIEQKSVCYDEIIKKANKMHSENCEACKACLEELIPELAESEDERVRKELIDYINSEYRHTLGLDKKNRFIAWLEKQGEQKPVFEMKTPEESLGIDSETYSKIVDECIYGEQTPTDKVEPKFKVGDKIYLKPEYRIPDDDTPIANTVFEIRAIDGKHYKFDGSYIFIEDQDKYELVEQKPSENEELTEFDKAVGVSIGTWNPKTPEQIQSVKAVSKKLLKLAKKQINDEQNPAWSEENEKVIDAAESWLDMLCGYLKNNFSQYIPVVKEVISELKSLKDRVQSRQEWKQENTHDLTDFENVMMHIGDSFFGQYAGLDPNDTIAIKEQATILLGLVPKQEWSEEDEEMLIEIVKDLQVYKSREISRDAKDAYQNEIDWLKSLRPQNRWKPSDEQMEALDDAIAICSERDYETECRLDNLRQDLRKLREE